MQALDLRPAERGEKRMPVLEATAPVGRNTHEKLNSLIEKARQYAPVKVAVAHPCDQVSLESAVAARESNAGRHFAYNQRCTPPLPTNCP